MGTCKTCKHWGNRYTYQLARRKCEHSKLGIHNLDIPEDGAEANGQEAYGIVTGPLFGCIHHEEK